MVASATSLARHAGTRPPWTWSHSRGRRWRSSRAWPISRFAAVVETPEHGTELGDTELRHRRTPLPGDRLLVLAPAGGERRGGVDRLRRVQIGPRRGQVEQVGAAWSSVALRSRAAARIPDASRSSTSGLLVEEREVLGGGHENHSSRAHRHSGLRKGDLWRSIFEQVNPRSALV